LPSCAKTPMRKISIAWTALDLCQVEVGVCRNRFSPPGSYIMGGIKYTGAVWLDMKLLMVPQLAYGYLNIPCHH
jgi:hypothetical protein